VKVTGVVFSARSPAVTVAMPVKLLAAVKV
jgi:hypothetical protein